MISPYKIYWVVAAPKKGKATNRDAHQLQMMNGGCLLFEHFGTKERAEKFRKGLKRKQPFKDYDVFVISDKQFGMLKKTDIEGLNDVLTTKQKSEKVRLKSKN